jgi:putative endonuclease
MGMTWTLYILECADGSFYTGISNDLDKRIKAHNDGLGAKYTRGRAPVRLLASKLFDSRSEASIAESLVKKLAKNDKLGFFK